jgi:hypothetical protein
MTPLPRLRALTPAAVSRNQVIVPTIPRLRAPVDPAPADTKKPREVASAGGADPSDVWAWVELNYRPHAYQPPKPDADQRPPS